MPSGGAPPFPGTGLAELEALEEGDTSSNALRLSGTATPWYAGAAVSVLYGQAANAPAFAWQAHASGLMGWKLTETATTNSAKWGTQFGVPLYVNPANYPPAAIRHRRYRYAALIGRTTTPSAGGCGIGLYQPVATGGTGGGEKGIDLRSITGVYGGNWHAARKWYPADPVTVYADSGIPASTAPFVALFDFRTGPNGRSLVVSINGVAVATLGEADLPQLGPDGSFAACTPGFYSAVTGTPGLFQVMQSQFREDRLT